MAAKQKLSKTEIAALLKTLQTRFEKNKQLHKAIDWKKVQERLESGGKNIEEKLWSLQQMEDSGGEPDVIEIDKKTGELIFFDCSPESPAGRRSLCYDRRALNARKENKPKNAAMDMAA